MIHRALTVLALLIALLLPGDPGDNCGPDHREGCIVPVVNNYYLPVVGK